MGEAAQRQAATLAVLIEGRRQAQACDTAGNLVDGNEIEYDLRDPLVRAWFAEWLVPVTDLDRLTDILRRAHDAMSRREPDGISDAEWDALVADMANELGVQS